MHLPHQVLHVARKISVADNHSRLTIAQKLNCCLNKIDFTKTLNAKIYIRSENNQKNLLQSARVYHTYYSNLIGMTEEFTGINC